MGRILICMLFLLATVVPSRAAVVRLIEDAPGNYRLEGEQLEGVAAIDVTIDYDTASLQITSVTQGSLLTGTLFAGNANQAGRVRIGAVGTQTLSGSGVLARLSGTVHDPPARFSGIAAKLSDASGLPLRVRTEYQQSNSALTQPPAETQLPQEQLVTPAPTTSQGGALVVIGQPDSDSRDEATAPPDDQPDIPPQEPYLVPLLEEVPSTQAEAESSRPATEPYIEKQKHTVVETLLQFEKYAGPRTLAKMAALFLRADSELQQRPEILLADGKTSVEVEFSINIKHGKKPSVALRNARLLSAKAVAEGRFLVRCTPKEGALSVKILYLGGEEIIEIPLTVAPPISLAGIEVRGEETLPRLDLDGDGESTWRDDYILVANLLAQGKPTK